MRDLVRRLAALEHAAPTSAPHRDLTDADRDNLVALKALAVALTFGEHEPTDEPMAVLHRGIDRAHEPGDSVTPLRGSFAERCEDAWAKAINGNQSVAVPPDWATRTWAYLDHPDAGRLVGAYRELRPMHPDFADHRRRGDLMTTIGGDGVERYRWPERAGRDTPDAGPRGQGLAAAGRYWA